MPKYIHNVLYFIISTWPVRVGGYVTAIRSLTDT